MASVSELKSILNSIDPEVQENTQDGFYNVPSYEYVYDVQSQQVKKKNIMSMFEPGGFYADPTGDRTQKYIKERYINAPTKITKNIATETPLVVQDTLDTIAEEFTDFGDNVLFYTNKYNPAHTLGEYPLPDAKNIFYDEKEGKGNIRSAWDFYRTGNGLIEVQEPQTVVGDLAADVGAFLVPWIYGTKIVQTPQMISRGKKYLDRAFRWAVSGAAVEFAYGTESKEDESILGMVTGFSPTTQTGLKNLMHNSFLNDDDAEQFANHLDHAVNSGIDEGILSLAFSGIGHIFKSSYFKMFPDEAVKSAQKSWQRDHAIPFSKYAERNPGITNKDTLVKYMKQPKVKTWFTDESRRFFITKNVDDFIKQFEAEVFGPVQIGKGAYNNGFDVFSNGYSTYKKNIVKLYKRMQANKINGLKIFLAGGAAYTAMSSSDAEAGILNKSIQKYFQKGGQKLFQRGADNKLIPITHDDVLAMPVAKEIFIQSQEAEGEWIVHQNKDEYLASEDGYAANPLDLLPNQKYPYYDALSEKIRGMNFKSMPKEQFLNTITNTPGIKKDEIETTELVQFVNSVEGDKITKQDLLTNWYDSSRIKLKTRLMGSDNGSGEMEEAYGRYENYITPGDYDKYKEHLITFERRDTPQLLEEFESRAYTLNDLNFDLNFGDGSYVVRRTGSAEVVSEGSMVGKIAGPVVDKIKQDTGLERSQIIGNPKYETILAEGMLENINEEIMFEIREELGTSFKSGHFGPKDILAHTRSTERNINGTPSFFIEEVQSDMHQIGMKQGYRNTEEFLKLKQRHVELTQLMNDANKNLNLGSKYSDIPEKLNIRQSFEELKIEFSNVSDALLNFNKRIPDAPFKNEKDWVSLSLKEMVNFAAKKGYDQIAWTSGRLQNERYNIGQYVDELTVKPNPGNASLEAEGIPQRPGYLRVEGFQAESGQVFNEPIHIDALDETVGKPLATKIRAGMENAPDEFKKFGLNFSGLDLNLAGEGKTLQRFYDNLIPSLLKKMYEKDGVKFGTTSLETAIDSKPAPYEEMSDDLFNEAMEYVGIRQLTDNEIKKEGLAIVEGFEYYGLEVNDEYILVQSFEINDDRQLEAPLYQDLLLQQRLVPPRLEGTTRERAEEYFQDAESDATFDIAQNLYDDYVREFEKNRNAEDSVERNILFMTIPENLKDRVLKLGQPLFGSNPSKLGAYENKTTQ